MHSLVIPLTLMAGMAFVLFVIGPIINDWINGR